MAREQGQRESVAYVGVGGNVGRPEATLPAALAALAVADGVRGASASPVYRSSPVGGIAQPDFLNAVVRLRTTLPPHDLLDMLLALESQFGRQRDERWGPRTLDLDVLLYDDIVLHHPRLVVPHPELVERGFVLAPLADLAPSLRHPVEGKTIARLLRAWRERAGEHEQRVERLETPLTGWPAMEGLPAARVVST